MSKKLMLSWIAGSVLILAAVWIIENLKFDFGVSIISYILAVLIAFVLILAGGLLWISVAVATKRHLT
jgi:NADH:ubiquinone oxidoreductase subunit 6 (subunit J)